MFMKFLQILLLTYIVRCKDLYEQFIKCEYYSCYPQNNNFIRNYLLDVPINEKLQKLNEQVHIYSKKKLFIMESQGKGLGVFLNETINPQEKIFSYKLKNIIGTRQINQKMFKLNTLTRQHKQFKLNFNNINRIIQDKKKTKQTLFVLNFFYHFCRFEDSYLKNDLIAIPTQNMFPFYMITPYEFSLITQNIEYFQIKEIKQTAVQDYTLLLKCLSELMTEQQFLLFFQRDNITFDEFLYIQYIQNTRQHQNHEDGFMFPILHYSNQASNIDKYQYTIFSETVQGNYEFYSTKEKQEKGQEFLINYSYESLASYAFKSGFVPNITNLDCTQIQVLDKEIALINKLESQICINKTSLMQYTFHLINQIDVQLMEECLINSSQSLQEQIYYLQDNHVDLNLQSVEENTDEIFTVQYKLWKECQSMYKNHQDKPFDIWDNAIRQINEQKEIYSQNIIEIQDYMKMRLVNNKDIYIAQLLLDYQSQYFQLAIQAEQNLLNFFQLYDELSSQI